MTHPPQPPQPPQPTPPPQGDPPPPQPTGDPPAPAPAPTDPPDLETALRRERGAREALQRELDKLRQANMSDQEKLIAKARDEGRAEANAESARQLAAVQFEHAATGRIADPAAALELIDVGKLLDEHGQPSAKAIAAAVDRLAGPAPDPDDPAAGNGHLPAGRIPGGVRQPAPPDRGDFIRSALRSSNR